MKVTFIDVILGATFFVFLGFALGSGGCPKPAPSLSVFHVPRQGFSGLTWCSKNGETWWKPRIENRESKDGTPEYFACYAEDEPQDDSTFKTQRTQ